MIFIEFFFNVSSEPKETSEPATAQSPRETSSSSNKQEMDLDAIKPSEQLSHMQRAKPPSKNPPSKFKVFFVSFLLLCLESLKTVDHVTER